MSEEIRNPGMEMNESALKGAGETNTPPQLNDAALEGVSGGYMHYEAVRQAQQHCNSCDRYCGASIDKLAEYIWAHSNFKSYTDCPYYSK